MLYLFLDTNIWLHFRPVEEIDWIEALGPTRSTHDGAIEIVVSYLLIDELDRAKDSASSSRVRDRARRALKQIESWDPISGAVLREAVIGRYRDLPSGDLAILRLDAARQDDVLLGIADTFRASKPDDRIVIVTDDTGPRLKARRLKLEVIGPPEEARLPAPQDPIEKENRELRATVDRLANRLPRLVVRFRDGKGGGTRLEAHLKSLAATEAHFVQHAVAAAAADVPELRSKPRETSPVENAGLSAMSELARSAASMAQIRDLMNPIAGGEYDRYATDRAEYLRKVEEAARVEWQWQERMARSVEVCLVLLNDGSAPADDIDAHVHVPNGPEVSTETKPDPLEIQKPTRPRSPFQLMAEGMQFPNIISPYGNWRPSPPSVPSNVSAPRIRESNSFDIDVQVRRAKQHQEHELVTFRLEFPSIDAARSLTLEYRVNSASLPEPVGGSLHIVLDTKGAN